MKETKQKNMDRSETMNLQVNNNLEHLKKKKLFLFDIDGTIALSEDVIEGTFQLLSHIREIGGRAVYICLLYTSPSPRDA